MVWICLLCATKTIAVVLGATVVHHLSIPGQSWDNLESDMTRIEQNLISISAAPPVRCSMSKAKGWRLLLPVEMCGAILRSGCCSEACSIVDSGVLWSDPLDFVRNPGFKILSTSVHANVVPFHKGSERGTLHYIALSGNPYPILPETSWQCRVYPIRLQGHCLSSIRNTVDFHMGLQRDDIDDNLVIEQLWYQNRPHVKFLCWYWNHDEGRD